MSMSAMVQVPIATYKVPGALSRCGPIMDLNVDFNITHPKVILLGRESGGEYSIFNTFPC